MQQQMKIGQLKLLPLPAFIPTCLTDVAAPKAGMSDLLMNQLLTHPAFSLVFSGNLTSKLVYHRQTAMGSNSFSHLMLIHCCAPDKAAGPVTPPAMLEDQDPSGPSWKQGLAEVGGLALSAQGPTCGLSENLLQASKRTVIWERIHRAKEI